MYRLILAVTLTGFALTGCGGGGSSNTGSNPPTGAVTGIEMPSTMSVVTAQGSGQVSGVLRSEEHTSELQSH